MKGFTLIELLITVSIIAVLSAIGLVVYSTVIKQGQDGKRQSDLRAIQSALEQYNNDQFFYPTTTGLDGILNPPSSFTSSVGNPNPPSPAKTYLNSPPQDPTDPTGTTRYRYAALPDSCDNLTTNKCTSYCLYAKLQNSNPGRPAACTNAAYNFAVTPP